jgi:hypothetical protein
MHIPVASGGTQMSRHLWSRRQALGAKPIPCGNAHEVLLWEGTPVNADPGSYR